MCQPSSNSINKINIAVIVSLYMYINQISMLVACE